MSEHPAITMSAASAIGGMIGYIKTGSMISAGAGLAFATLYGFNAKMIKDQSDYAYPSTAVSSFLLTAAQTPRAVKFKTPVPIGLASCAFLTGIYYSKKAYEEVYGV